MNAYRCDKCKGFFEGSAPHKLIADGQTLDACETCASHARTFPPARARIAIHYSPKENTFRFSTIDDHTDVTLHEAYAILEVSLNSQDYVRVSCLTLNLLKNRARHYRFIRGSEYQIPSVCPTCGGPIVI